MEPNPLATHNLANQVSRERVLRPAGFWSGVVLDVLVVISAFATSFVYASYLRREISFVWLAVSVGVFALCSIFGLFLTKNPGRRFAVVVLEVLGFVSAFVVSVPLSTLALVVAVGVVLFVIGEESGRKQLHNSFEIRFFRIARLQLGKVMTGLVLMGVLLYVPARSAAGEQLFLSEQAYQTIFRLSMDTAQSLYPEINLRSTVGELSKSVVAFQFRDNQTFLNLSGSERAMATQGLIDQFMSSVTKTLGISVAPSDTIQAVTYRYFVRAIENWQEKLGDRFAIVWGVAVFFLVRGVASLFSLVVIAIGFAIYQLLLALRIIQIGAETKVRQTLEWA